MNVKISDQLFLGSEELNRLKLSIFDQGYKFALQAIASQFGIIRNNPLDPNFNYFKVGGGNSPNSIALNEGYAFDKNGSVIHQLPNQPNIPVLNANIWQWVKISYAFSTIENGTVSIGGTNGGLMVGVGTEFTNILRGQPDYPSKIRLVNSVNYNTLEYEVLEVIDDNNVKINGVFDTAETNLQFIVVGTFTPGTYPTASQEQPFQYDNCFVSLVNETIFDTPPALNSGLEFFVARINNTITSIVIQDKRSDYLFKTINTAKLEQISSTNPLIGVTAVKKFTNRSISNYSVEFDFKFNIGSETRNLQADIISLSSGQGGAYKSTADFVTGDFDGWNYHYTDGTFTPIIKSIKNNNNIDLYVENIEADKIGYIVAPNATEVEIRADFCDPTNATVLFTENWLFPIDATNPRLLFNSSFITANGGQNVVVKWKHRLFQTTTTDNPLNSSQFYTEDGYNSLGVLTDPTKTLTQVNPRVGITLS